MISFIIDNEVSNPGTIVYHSQKKPRPGGHFYSITISEDEKKLIEIFEKMLEIKIAETDFGNKAKQTGINSAFNLVTWTLDFVNPQTMTKETKWVFNSIKNVNINGLVVIIEGEASLFVDNFK